MAWKDLRCDDDAQASLMFTRQIPGFMLAGQMCYCQKNDSIVLCTAAFNLESYKFVGLFDGDVC